MVLQMQPPKCAVTYLDLLAMILQIQEWDIQIMGDSVIRHNSVLSKKSARELNLFFPVITTLHIH